MCSSILVLWDSVSWVTEKFYCCLVLKDYLA